MATTDIYLPAPHRTPAALPWTAISFFYWLTFLAVLTPGNVQNGLDAGVAPDLAREALRLAAAAMLGASVTPLLNVLARAPANSPRDAPRSIAIAALTVSALAVGLIVVSCFLVAWASGRLAPGAETVRAHLFANFLLLVFGMAQLLAAMRLAPLLLERVGIGSRWIERIAVAGRSGATIVRVADIEYIESQGNYQALHTAGGVHLHRETSLELESKLDPSLFVRIHRRYLVALDRIRTIEPLSSGDAIVRLTSGAELRQSRQYRRRLRESLAR